MRFTGDSDEPFDFDAAEHQLRDTPTATSSLRAHAIDAWDDYQANRTHEALQAAGDVLDELLGSSDGTNVDTTVHAYDGNVSVVMTIDQMRFKVTVPPEKPPFVQVKVKGSTDSWRNLLSLGQLGEIISRNAVEIQG